MPESPFKWNAGAGQYINSAGRFVPRKQVQVAFERAIVSSARVMETAANGLRSGSISLRQWQVVMRAEIKNVHLYTGAIAKGGFAQMSQADFGRIGQRIKEQYGFLDKMAADIASGRQPLDGRLVSRSRLYGQSGRQTMHLVERAEMKSRGYTQERNILSATEHCDECVEQTERDWVPIGDLLPIGMRTCNMNDACQIDYR